MCSCCVLVTYSGARPCQTSRYQGINYGEVPYSYNPMRIDAFLGMAGYYRKFYKNFSLVAESLTRCLRKDQKFEWDMKCTEALKKIKGLLVSAPVIVTPHYDKPFC